MIYLEFEHFRIAKLSFNGKECQENQYKIIGIVNIGRLWVGGLGDNKSQILGSSIVRRVVMMRCETHRD